MKIIGNIIATIYFFCLLPILLLLLFSPFVYLMEIDSIRTSGFVGNGAAIPLLGFSSLLIAISMLVPPIRKLYWVMPWLYPFVKIMFINFAILMFGSIILSHGYEVLNDSRHSKYFLIMIAFLIVSRLMMCIYFKWRPVYEEE